MAIIVTKTITDTPRWFLHKLDIKFRKEQTS